MDACCESMAVAPLRSAPQDGWGVQSPARVGDPGKLSIGGVSYSFARAAISDTSFASSRGAQWLWACHALRLSLVISARTAPYNSLLSEAVVFDRSIAARFGDKYDLHPIFFVDVSLRIARRSV